MDYESRFRQHLEALHAEGRYRVFADLKRRCGAYPTADHFAEDGVSDVTVWCSNDYLGMSQSPVVRDAMHEAIEEVGAGSGGTRNISGTTHYHVELEAELADLHGKEAALLFTSRLCRQRLDALHAATADAGAGDLLRREEPRLDDRGHPPGRRREAHLPP